ncbi:MAG: glycosyltransferase [Thermoguttaceae bacterium]|nr:glycosyltransferase [Thermoguttaceae bacterium]
MKMTGELLPEPTLKDLPAMAGRTIYQQIRDASIPRMEPKLLVELENLRGEPIQFMNPHIIPCTEVSDEAVRSVEPLVSVWMITYNHENFITEAIEGVVHQETNFPFELIIGEDCSTDRTREIALEYQKKYPHIIRVQYARENSIRNPPVDGDGRIAGGNGMRTTMSCRGKYVAYCEGDDYWTDMKKLQKQVDILESHPEVGMCCANAQELVSGEFRPVSYMKNYQPGYYSGEDAWKLVLWEGGGGFHPTTATTMTRRQVIHNFYLHNPIAYARLRLGDTTLWLECFRFLGMCCMSDCVAVRRAHGGSATAGIGRQKVQRDGTLVLWNFYQQKQLLTSEKRLQFWRQQLLSTRLALAEYDKNRGAIIEIYCQACLKKVLQPCTASWMILLECARLRCLYSMPFRMYSRVRGSLGKIHFLVSVKSFFSSSFRKRP